jgi:hypothetical protein
MAARTRSGTKDSPWSAKTRERIKTSMLVNRLSDFVEGKAVMDSAQVTAALGLLRKALPDLSAQDVTVDTAQPFAVLPSVIEDTEAWTATFDPLKDKH